MPSLLAYFVVLSDPICPSCGEHLKSDEEPESAGVSDQFKFPELVTKVRNVSLAVFS